MTTRIKLLPDYISNQIAAGEVIQRPSSVVKELLENSVDANSKNIQLIIKDGGKTLIQVVDDGSGINRDDLSLAFQRHATSKIRGTDDLYNLKTKGFRGEALASIAAISSIETHTRTFKDEVSQFMKMEAGKVTEQKFSTQPKGTSISIKNLFYNVPARRNFLRSDAVELRHIVDEFNRISLAHPEINFLFYNNGNELFDLSVNKSKKRICSVFGSKWENHLIPITETTTLVKLEGYIVKPEFSKKTRGHQFFFVNNRFIKSPFLHHAVCSAFEGLLRTGYNPGYFLYLTVDPKSIDINIHPTKTEIKFEQDQSIYSILRAAVKHSLGIFQVIPALDFDKDKSLDIPYSFNQKKPTFPTIEVDSNFNPFTNSSINSKKQKDLSWNDIPSNVKLDYNLKNNYNSYGSEELFDVTKNNRVFQLFSKYIVCPLKTSMIIIDQCRAHQRVLYERFLSSMTSKKSVTQKLLYPLEIKLNPEQKNEYSEIKDVIKSLGFEIKQKKQSVLLILSCPQYFPQSKIEELIDYILSSDYKKITEDYFSQADKIAKLLSKQLSIKKGKHLESEELQSLLDDFFGCKETTISPFNKPIFITLEKSELDQKLN